LKSSLIHPKKRWRNRQPEAASPVFITNRISGSIAGWSLFLAPESADSRQREHFALEIPPDILFDCQFRQAFDAAQSDSNHIAWIKNSPPSFLEPGPKHPASTTVGPTKPSRPASWGHREVSPTCASKSLPFPRRRNLHSERSSMNSRANS